MSKVLVIHCGQRGVGFEEYSEGSDGKDGKKRGRLRIEEWRIINERGA